MSDEKMDQNPIVGYYRSQFSHWYPFLKEYSFESEVVELDKDFIEYMNEDGIFMGNTNRNVLNDVDGDSDASSTTSSSSETPVQSEFSTRFPDLVKKIEEAIERLGGSVFCKMNWSSPKDAAWMARGQTLECINADEIILLLKASDFITHDIEKLEEVRGVKPELVLRRWHPNLKSCNEWRCFVKDGKLIGICQRDINSYYSFLNKEETKEMIQEFLAGIQDDLDKVGSQNYVIDLILRGKETWQVMDLNPWVEETEALLFDWEWLNSDKTDGSEVQIRIVESEQEKRLHGPERYASMPVELAELGHKDAAEILGMIDKWEQDNLTGGGNAGEPASP